MRAIAATVSAFTAWLLLRRRRARRPATSVIVSDRRSTVVAADGAVRSVQSAHLTLPRSELHRLWTVPNLENLARTYWEFLGRATMHLTHVSYSDDARSVVLLSDRVRLLRFERPEYVFEPGGGTITWRIRDGLLVAPARNGCGWLRLEVRDLTTGVSTNGGGQATLEIRVEVANFYPALAAGLGVRFYTATQSLVHVLVTHGFLRSLASLRLAESRIGRLRGPRPR